MCLLTSVGISVRNCRVPACKPVTTPLELIEATLVLLENQGVDVDGEPEPVSVMVALTQTVLLPEMVGNGNTVT